MATHKTGTKEEWLAARAELLRAEKELTHRSAFTRESPGMSAFALENGVVYHTCSATDRGLDVLWNMYQWLDRAPLGRNETHYWIRRRDEYSA